ncbi:MAG: ATPase domain-containing protein [Methanothrix sp.]|nr:ATPase domain-containing protein [Methanothrix sp.]
MNLIERMPTGIPGLDAMIEGGLPRPSLTLLAGNAGAGKTTFCTQFLCKGADLGERGLYLLTFGGPPDLLINYASSYEFVKSTYFGKEICYLELEEMVEKACRLQDFLNILEKDIDTFQPTRIVIENLSILEDVLKDDYWRFLLKLSHLIKAKRMVALVAEDAQPEAPYPAHIAQIADGIILLQNEEINFARRRSIEIVKMCGTSHHLGKHAVDISVKGLIVYPGL